jgi:phage shock protein PspC (stress-responsive transcriptional regulator)
MEHTARSRRQLVRNTKEGKIAGVAAGLGDYIGIDPVLIRLGFLLAILAGGLGVLAYLVAWAVIPAGEPGAAPAAPRPLSSQGTRWVVGAGLVVAGVVVFAGSLQIWSRLDGSELLSVLLVAAGVALLLWRRDDAGPGDAPGTPAGPSAPTPQAGPTRTDDEAFDDTATGPVPDPTVPDPDDQPTTRLEDTAIRAFAPLPLPPPPPEDTRRRYPLGVIALGAIVVSAAVAALLDATGAVDVSVLWFLVYALGLSGAALIASGWFGRKRGPIALTTVLAAAVAFAAIVNVSLRGGIGDRTLVPQSLAELGADQRLGIGRLVIDLRELPLAGHTWRLEAGVGVGELVVLLPPGAETGIEGRASVGEVDLFQRQENGVHVDTSWGGGSAYVPGVLALDLEVGVGRIETRTAPAPLPGESL